MKRRRIVLLCLLAIGLAPGTWLRDDPDLVVEDRVTLVPLPVTQPESWPDALVLEAAWDMQNANPDFGGFSAMVADPLHPAFRLFSDKGRTAFVPRPGNSLTAIAHTQWVPHDPLLANVPDIESAVIDPQTGTLWLGYEFNNAIRRFPLKGEPELIQPPAMQDWSANSGPEAMMRLPDGRFVVLAEVVPEGLLFPGDPVAGAEPVTFAFHPPEGFRPTAMGLLPDGRALIVLRATAWQIPPFNVRLVLADPDMISADEDWAYEELARFDDLALIDNYEGIWIEDAGDGEAIIWLISDDNLSFLQRSLLLKLRFEYGAHSETAREADASGPPGE